MVLNLSKRGCSLGGKLNPRNEYHGDEEVPACDFALTGLMLEANELNLLLDGEEETPEGTLSAWERLFTAAELPEPAFRSIDLKLDKKFEKSSVTLKLGNLNDDTLKFGGAKISKITLSPQTGGLTALRLQISANAEAAQVALLYTSMGHEVSATIRFGKEAVKTKEQPELPLDHQKPETEENAENLAA